MEEFARQELDALETAWGVIANVSGGDWTKQSPEWQEAAARFRDQYHAVLDKRPDSIRESHPYLPQVVA